MAETARGGGAPISRGQEKGKHRFLGGLGDWTLASLKGFRSSEGEMRRIPHERGKKGLTALPGKGGKRRRS